MPEPNENGAIQTPEVPADKTPELASGGEPNGTEENGTPESNGQPEMPKWKAQLPDKWKKDTRLDKYNSLDEAMAGLLDGSDASSESENAGDGDDAEKTDEETDEKLVEYKFSKKFPKDIDSSGSLANAITDSLKSLKLSAEKADAVNSAIIDAHTSAIEKMKADGSKLLKDELKKIWGEKYDINAEFVSRAKSQLIPEGSDLAKGLDATYATNNPYVVQLLAKVGDLLNEHNTPRTKVSVEGERPSGFLSRDSQDYPWRR